MPAAPQSPGPDAGLVPISMHDAVGYPNVECMHETALDEYLVLKHERLFLLVDPHGNIAPPGRCGLGLFHRDTRILSEYALSFRGGPASLLSSQASRMYGAQVDLAITDLDFGGSTWDPKNSVHIRRELLLDDRLTERVTLTNFLTVPIDFWMELSVGCDFADIFEVRGWKRARRGQFYAPGVGDRAMVFGYRGVDGALLGTLVRFAEAPDELRPGRARWQMRLEPNAPREIEWQVIPPDVAERAVHSYTGGTLERRRPPMEMLYEGWRSECTQWSSGVEEFDAALARAVLDLRALYLNEDGEEVISAGIPWYSTAFGRDSILAWMQTLSVNPRIARDTLRYLARHQGREENAYTEEQPGKIMHEIRRGEMARAGEIPHLPYFGTVDATPLWLVLLHEAWRWTGDAGLVRELLPNAERALQWIDHYGDLDGEGWSSTLVPPRGVGQPGVEGLG